ncbi:MAG: tyrosine-type recombinase/integrase [Spirochaetota bacterium]
MTKEECDRLLSMPKIHTRTGLRNAAIMRILIEGGLKISELVGKETVRDGFSRPEEQGGLQIGDILWDENAIVARRHGERRVPLCDETIALLKKWIYVRPQSDSLLVFTTLQGNKLKNRYVREFLARYGREAGVAVSVTPSVLRNSFARRVRECGGGVELVRARLGLSSTTKPPSLEDRK